MWIPARYVIASLWLLLAGAPCYAVEGIVINIRNLGSTSSVDSLQYYGAIDGELWRHDIKNDAVVSHKKIHDGPASRPAISPDGAHVAFIRRTSSSAGEVVVVDIDGRNEVVLATCLRSSLVDFPHKDWVYFTMGSFHDSTSGQLKRVNVRTKAVEDVMQIKGHNGKKTRVAQIQISNDLSRAAMRTGDSESDPAGAIVALSLNDDDKVDQVISGAYSCAAGFFADGQHAMDGNEAHDGFDIRRYSDGGRVKSFKNRDAFQWPPNNGDGNPVDYEHAIFNAGAATNSDRWMTIVLGGQRNYKWHAPLLINWKDERTIYYTKGLKGPWDNGDFWVGTIGSGGSGDTDAPQIVEARTSAGQPDELAVIFSEPLQRATAEDTSHYAISGGIAVSQAALDSSGKVLSLQTSTFKDGSYSLTVNGVKDVAGNTIAKDSQVNFVYQAQAENQAPSVHAGDDQTAFANVAFTVVGSIVDDGLPAGATVTAAWDVTAGDAEAVAIDDPDQAITAVTISTPGSYTLRLTGSDGALDASDELVVAVSATQGITLISPKGGERWPAGSTQSIEWTTVSVDDVFILLSLDDGENWETIVPSVDTDSPSWGKYPFEVPETVTDGARIRIDAYIQGEAGPTESGAFSIVAAGEKGTDAGPSAAAQDGGTAASPGGGLAGGCNMGPEAPVPGAASGLLGWITLIYVTRRRRSRAPTR